LKIKVPDNFVLSFCKCGGVLSALIGSTRLVCIDCETQFRIEVVHDV